MSKIKNIGVFYNPRKKQVKEFFKLFEKWADKKKVNYNIFHEMPASIPEIDLAVVLGGDGTILHIGRFLAGSKIPIIGVNMGRMGFLAETSITDLWKELDEIILKKINNIQKRFLLEIQIKRNKSVFQEYNAVNDIVIKNGERARVVDLDVAVDNEFVARYTGDGVIISTPTGSTAYSLASGGPIVYPLLDLMIISAISPHTLALRPLIINASKKITIDSVHKGQDVILCVDGQSMQKILKDDEIIIKRSNKAMYLVISKKQNYFEVLRKKLGWGKHISSRRVKK
ncbi:NAD(+)/NADH kinase [bacterium]